MKSRMAIFITGILIRAYWWISNIFLLSFAGYRKARKGWTILKQSNRTAVSRPPIKPTVNMPVADNMLQFRPKKKLQVLESSEMH